jgi:hypothetical protein
MDKDREQVKQALNFKFNELVKESPKEQKIKALNLREYMDLAKQCKDIDSLRDWFKSVQANAETDLTDDDFQALIEELKRVRNQFLVNKPDDKKNVGVAAQLSDYLRESPNLKELEHRLTETTKERTKLPKALRTWLNTEIESIKKGLKNK